MITEPTAGDLARNLVADMLICKAQDTEWRWGEGFRVIALEGWPVAIRRAAHAEAEVQRLKAMYEAACLQIASHQGDGERRIGK